MSRFQTVEAFVIHKADKACYAWCADFPKDVIIDQRTWPQNEDILGKWLELEVEEERGFRARRISRILPDRYEYRPYNNFAEIRVEIRHDGTFENRLEMYYNNHLQYICDPQNVIQNPRSDVSYFVWVFARKEPGVNARWIISRKNENIIIHNNSNREDVEYPRGDGPSRVVQGLVYTALRGSNDYFAWSKDKATSTIRIGGEFCDFNRNLVGQWAEMEIDEKNRVLRPIKLLNDFYETRVRAGVAEFWVEMQQIDEYRRQGVYYHTYFGRILDSESVIDIENGAWYKSWISYERNDEARTRFIVSTFQPIPNPLRDNRSPSPRRNGPSQNDSFEPRNRNRSRSVDRYSNQGSRPGAQERSLSPRLNSRRNDNQPTPSSNIYRRDDSPLRRSDYPNENGYRNQGAGSSRNYPTSSNSSDCGVPMLNRQESSRPTSSMNYSRRNEEAHDLGPTSSNSAAPSRTGINEEDKEMKRLNKRFSKMAQIIRSFASDDTVSMAMKKINLTDFDELMDLVKK